VHIAVMGIRTVYLADRYVKIHIFVSFLCRNITRRSDDRSEQF